MPVRSCDGEGLSDATMAVWSGVALRDLPQRARGAAGPGRSPGRVNRPAQALVQFDLRVSQ